MKSVRPPVLWTNLLLFVITSTLAVVAVPLYGWWHGYDGFEVGLFLFFGAASGTAITAGFHRLWSHQAYEAHPLLRLWFALWGAAALQNSILNWASDHRRHHRHVDDPQLDPYSARRGFWFAHIGWMLREYRAQQDDFSNVKDLQKDPIVMWQHRNYLLLVLLMNVALPALIGVVHGDLLGSLLLAGVLRLVVVHHFTFFINSLAHFWGRQPYSSDCTARDNAVVALLTFGEGYHNFHHQFQWDYRNGIRWWQFDPTKWLIRVCAWLGLSRNLKRCSPEKIEQAILQQQFRRSSQQISRLPDADSHLRRLQQEYDRLIEMVQAWGESRQRWADARANQLLQQWERAQIRRSCLELRQRLLEQRRDWELLLAHLT